MPDEAGGPTRRDADRPAKGRLDRMQGVHRTYGGDRLGLRTCGKRANLYALPQFSPNQD